MKMVIAQVHQEPKKFAAASDGGWVMAVGHQMDINEYEFVAIPMLVAKKADESKVVVIEKGSGCGVAEFAIGPDLYDLLETHSKAMMFFERVLVPKVFEIMEENKEKMDAEIQEKKTMALQKLGPMPEEQEINFAEIEKEFEKEGEKG